MFYTLSRIYTNDCTRASVACDAPNKQKMAKEKNITLNHAWKLLSSSADLVALDVYTSFQSQVNEDPIRIKLRFHATKEL